MPIVCLVCPSLPEWMNQIYEIIGEDHLRGHECLSRKRLLGIDSLGVPSLTGE
jgi:hypothetical protein